MNSLEITVHLRSEQTILDSPSLEITGRSGTDRVASKQELKLQWQYVDLRTTHGLIYHATSSLYVLQRSFCNLEESLQLFFVFSLSIIFFFIRDTSFEMLEILESGNQPGSIVFRGGRSVVFKENFSSSSVSPRRYCALQSGIISSKTLSDLWKTFISC